MARDLTIAVCQTGPIQKSAQRAETVDRLVALLERAAAAGAEIAVFPELALTTFFPRWRIDDQAEIEAFFEPAMPGPQTQRLYDAAARLKIGFALGYAELARVDGGRFNTMDLVGQD
ncbi:MAG: N-carbamoyl-D-amino-acid hydrolase, partial [Mesorhizobium sp.]